MRYHEDLVEDHYGRITNPPIPDTRPVLDTGAKEANRGVRVSRTYHAISRVTYQKRIRSQNLSVSAQYHTSNNDITKEVSELGYGVGIRDT